MLGYMARKLIQSCKTSSSSTASKNLTSLDLNNTAMDDTETGKIKMDNDKAKRTYIYVKYNFCVFTETHSFRSFLQQHINLAFARGFDDNVSRHSVPAHFEVHEYEICR